MIPCASVGSCRPHKRQIIALCSAGSKENLFFLYFHKLRKYFLCIFDITLRCHSLYMSGRRIPVIFTHDFVYKLSHTLISFGRRRIVQIYFSHAIYFLILFLVIKVCNYPSKWNINTASAASPAVSVRRIRFPSVITSAPCSKVRSTSSFSKPPSGPI